ncbi:hypothetical protein BC826DRAFT_1132038 [Russula brevipes]|nr:hypothetical protein BC826DRAFT_1132038 [Russula brevipes]
MVHSPSLTEVYWSWQCLNVLGVLAAGSVAVAQSHLLCGPVGPAPGFDHARLCDLGVDRHAHKCMLQAPGSLGTLESLRAQCAPSADFALALPLLCLPLLWVHQVAPSRAYTMRIYWESCEIEGWATTCYAPLCLHQDQAAAPEECDIQALDWHGFGAQAIWLLVYKLGTSGAFLWPGRAAGCVSGCLWWLPCLCRSSGTFVWGQPRGFYCTALFDGNALDSSGSKEHYRLAFFKVVHGPKRLRVKALDSHIFIGGLNLHLLHFDSPLQSIPSSSPDSHSQAAHLPHLSQQDFGTWKKKKAVMSTPAPQDLSTTTAPQAQETDNATTNAAAAATANNP